MYIDACEPTRVDLDLRIPKMSAGGNHVRAEGVPKQVRNTLFVWNWLQSPVIQSDPRYGP